MKYFPINEYLYSRTENNPNFKNNTFYKIKDDKVNPLYPTDTSFKIKEYDEIEDMKEETLFKIYHIVHINIICGIENNVKFEQQKYKKELLIENINNTYRDVLKQFKQSIEKIINDIMTIIMNRKDVILGNEYIVTYNGYLINLKNGGIREIMDGEHVFKSLNIKLLSECKNYTVHFIPDQILIKVKVEVADNNIIHILNIIRSILFGNNDIIILYKCNSTINTVKVILDKVFSTLIEQSHLDVTEKIIECVKCKSVLRVNEHYISNLYEEKNIYIVKHECENHNKNSYKSKENTILFEVPISTDATEIINYCCMIPENISVVFNKAIESNVINQKASDIFAMIVKECS